MIEAWFIILCLMITLFAVFNGWDFGAGALHYIVARNRDERRVLIAAIGPLWTWHEVWLVGLGGVLFVAFPRVLAIAFPAYYLALYMVLWTLLMRGLSLEFRGHIENVLWQTFWDFVFAVSNISLAVLFGAALGNVMRGMPLAPDKPLSLPLFTDFGVHGNVGILDWYTLSVALFTLVCLAAHGASYLTIKADGEVYRRSRALVSRLWLATAILLSVISAETLYVRPELVAGISSRVMAWVAIAIVLGGLGCIFTGLRAGAEHRVFFGSCALIAGLLGTAAASFFPVILHSTLAPEYSITAWNGSSDISNLQVAAYWWPVAFVLALTYFAFVAKHYGGRVQMSKDTQPPY